jgi:hypothetical protein
MQRGCGLKIEMALVLLADIIPRRTMRAQPMRCWRAYDCCCRLYDGALILPFQEFVARTDNGSTESMNR